MTDIASWKITMLLMGKSIILTGPFSIVLLNDQRVTTNHVRHLGFQQSWEMFLHIRCLMAWCLKSLVCLKAAFNILAAKPCLPVTDPAYPLTCSNP